MATFRGPSAAKLVHQQQWGFLAVLTFASAFVVGCVDALNPGVPFGQGAAVVRPAPKPAPSPSARPGSSGTGSGSAASPSGSFTLEVQQETLSASEIWTDRHEELKSQFEALPAEQFETFVRNRAAQLITDEVSESLLYQQASLRMEPRMTEAIERHVDSEIRKTVTAHHGGVQRKYEKELEVQGKNLDSVRVDLRREFIVGGYLEAEIKPKVAEPKRSDLYRVYEENVTTWRRPTRRSMSLIDVRFDEFLPDGVREPTREQWALAKAQAYERIRVAQGMIGEGFDFADAARRHSHGLHAEEGGRWGFVSAEGVRERFQPAVLALEKLEQGQVSDIVETPDGFFLVKCDEFEPGYDPDFASVQPELADRYFRIEFNRLISAHVEELRKKSGPTPEELDRFHRAVVDAAYQVVQQSH